VEIVLESQLMVICLWLAMNALFPCVVPVTITREKTGIKLVPNAKLDIRGTKGVREWMMMTTRMMLMTSIMSLLIRGNIRIDVHGKEKVLTYLLPQETDLTGLSLFSPMDNPSRVNFIVLHQKLDQ
jgi:hypothetical protein